ncbi:MAG: hypothetical protein [Podoviridae sp. ctLUJ1]|nr:MAG: hypothetical protein [Podoviridae sp. ctLUJ1]
MAITIQDTLRYPDYSPMPDTVIIITTLESTEVIKGSSLKVKTSTDGSFSTGLCTGKFSIEVKPCSGVQYAEFIVEVTDETPSPITLINLINNHSVTVQP